MRADTNCQFCSPSSASFASSSSRSTVNWDLSTSRARSLSQTPEVVRISRNPGHNGRDLSGHDARWRCRVEGAKFRRNTQYRALSGQRSVKDLRFILLCVVSVIHFFIIRFNCQLGLEHMSQAVSNGQQRSLRPFVSTIQLCILNCQGIVVEKSLPGTP